MRTLVGFSLSLLLATGLFAQHRGGFRNPRPFAQGTFSNAVFPGGQQLVLSGAVTDPTFATRLGVTVGGQNFRRQSFAPGAASGGTVITYGYPFAYAYPVYVGGYVDNDYPAEPAPQQQPDITVNDSSQPVQSVIQYFGPDDAQDPTTPTAADDDLQPMEEPDSTAEPSHYLIAFKDHTIYSAVAYWVDGDTLHYFTSANTHNQVSLALIDRDLTERLNKESGLDVKLPPPTPIR
jgi:hypothetical protein